MLSVALPSAISHADRFETEPRILLADVAPTPPLRDPEHLPPTSPVFARQTEAWFLKTSRHRYFGLATSARLPTCFHARISRAPDPLAEPAIRRSFEDPHAACRFLQSNLVSSTTSGCSSSAPSRGTSTRNAHAKPNRMQTMRALAGHIDRAFAEIRVPTMLGAPPGLRRPVWLFPDWLGPDTSCHT
jgi:hypothetical protein